MTGNYGSEVLRGHVAFKPAGLDKNLFEGGFYSFVKDAEATYEREAATVGRTTFICSKQVPWHHRSRLSVEESQVTLRSPFLDKNIVKLMYTAPPEPKGPHATALRLIAGADPRLARIPTDRGLVYKSNGLRTMMRRLYQEFTVRAEYAYDYGMPQGLARVDNALAALRVERLFLGRHKFYHFRVMYRDRLAAFVKEIILDSKTLSRSYLNGRKLEQLIKAHTDGRSNYTSEITKVLTSELLERELIEAR
jgi:asparagine synthase (glutamine-hydrolysing)